MRKLVTGIVITLVAAGCVGDDGSPAPPLAMPLRLEVHASPTTPFTQVQAGAVQALIPDRWRPGLTGVDGPQQGFIASPHPRHWGRGDGTVEGMAAVWVDVAEIGVPSDYYYFAASGPALARLTHSADCSPFDSRVIVDHAPALLAGPLDSPGDYVARGRGTCAANGRATRWAYFVAAPGYGPVRKVGIPNSGLYIVVAVIPDGRGADRLLDRLLSSTRFAGASVPDLIRAARSA